MQCILIGNAMHLSAYSCPSAFTVECILIGDCIKYILGAIAFKVYLGASAFTAYFGASAFQ